MLHSNTASDRLTNKYFNNSSNWDIQGVDGKSVLDTPKKIDRVTRKKNAEARRRVERLKEDLHLKELIDGERWY